MRKRNHLIKLASIFLILLAIARCAPASETPFQLAEPAASTSTPLPTSTSIPAPRPTPTITQSADELGLSEQEYSTLKTLEKVDDFPLYTMTYYGDYRHRLTSELDRREVAAELIFSNKPAWGCSLFAALGDEHNMLYGRNFDWEFSPALLLFTNEPGSMASVSMVDIAYLGFGGDKAGSLLDLPLDELEGLLDAPFLPFDGMNEIGLAIGMAAVPAGNMSMDPEKDTLGSLRVMREVLDSAFDVDDALEILRRYNIDFQGGPPLHYLIADRYGGSVLVEFYEGEMVVIPNDTPWHQATNFLRAAVGASPEGVCWRHDAISAQLEQTMGQTIGRGRLRPSGACVARRNPMVRRISNGPSPGACGDGATIRQRAHLQDSHSV
jgi:choloylglycine hydrolase